MLRSAIEVAKPPQGVDIIAITQYSKTRQRQMLLGVLAQQVMMSNPDSQLSKADLMRAGAHAGIFVDGWGNELRFQDSLVVSAGADGQFDTPDDSWLDARSMEPGGYFPNLDAAFQQMPMPPEARAMLEHSRQMQSEIEHNREQFMRSMDTKMKEAESPEFHQGSTVWSDSYRAVEAPAPEPEIEYPQAGS